MVLLAVKEKNEATLQEVGEYIAQKWKTDIESAKLNRYLRRWKKGKYIVANISGAEWLYSLRDIPWWPEAQMINILKPDTSDVEAKEFLDNYKDEVKKRGYIEPREPDIRDYECFEFTMELIDQMAGGLPSGDLETKLLKFPRRNGVPYMPRSWLSGWIRDNARLVNITQSIKYNLGVSPGIFVGDVKMLKETRIGKVGPQLYEVAPIGTRFKFTIEWPMHGTKIRSAEELEAYIRKLEIAPIKGLGTYEKAFGGRAKLLEMKQN